MFRPGVRIVLFGAILAPLAAIAASPDVRFGAQAHFAQGWDLGWVPLIQQTGVATVRDELYWSSIETTPGQYTFPAGFDAYMAALKQANLSPLIELDFANPNYDGGNTPYDATGFDAYAHYCVQVLDHYGAQINSVEIWNEYDGSFCTGPATANRPATYTQMLAAAYSAIKAARPDVTVAAGACAYDDLSFFQQMFADGALSSLDVLSLHPYRFTQPPEGLETEMTALQTLTRAYNAGQAKPIWVTEIGWYPHPSTGPADATITDDTQAQYLVRAYALLLSAGVQRVYWYLSRDNPEIDGGNDLGLMTEDEAAPLKPADVAMQNLTEQLAGATFIRREGTPNSTYSMLFQRSDGTQVRVLWATQPVTLSSAGAASAVDYLGNALPLTGSFQLSGAPIIVTGPWQGLPNQSGVVLADTLRDFSGTQGSAGWTLGEYVGGTNFQPMPTFQYSAAALPYWTDANYPWISITQGDQLPSYGGTWDATQISAVRRWTSTYNGTVEITGQFQTEQVGGDGVGVSVVVNGRQQFRQLIGTGWPSTSYAFDLVVPVQVGTTIDFAVDPGPSTNNSYDATAVQATITSYPVLADAQRDFAGTQGANGWTYGYTVGGGTFNELPTYGAPSWTSIAQWTDSAYPWLCVSPGDQLPSSSGSSPVAAVRRWTSDYDGTVEIKGQFQTEQTGGDGVGVSVLVDGRQQFRQLIGTGWPATSYAFDFFVPVQVGTAIDFAVDPGPSTNNSYDATAVTATILSSPVLADAQRDFSGVQGANGWTYGCTLGGSFSTLPTFGPPSWTSIPQWTNSAYPWLCVSQGDQLPSASGSTPVPAVRRWTSNYNGVVEIKGQFATEQTGGDGVGVSVLVNGQSQFRQLIGTGWPSATYPFDLFVPVQTGSTVDFSVDPGPSTNNSYDATAVQATISWAP